MATGRSGTHGFGVDEKEPELMRKHSPSGADRREGPASRWLSRRQIFGTAAAGTSAMAVFAACGQRGKGNPSSAKATGQAGKPKSGGQLNQTFTSDPFDFDPSGKATGLGNSNVIINVFDSLLHFKSGGDVPYDQLTLEPGLADRWEVPDAQSFIFHLHPGARFANLPPVGGREVTSADVKWSLEYLSRTGEFLKGKKVAPAQFQALYEGLEGIETPDDHTAVVRFGKPFAPFLNYAAAQFNPIVAHEIFDQDGSLSKRAVGTGPFQLDLSATQTGSRWVLKKNPTYFREGRPYIDQLNYLVIADDAAMFAAFQTKQLDLLSGQIGPDDANRVKKNSPDAVLYPYTVALPYHIYMNTKRQPFTDMRVRQALGLAINRDEFLKTFFGGKGGWALAGTFSSTYTQAELRQIIKYDPAQAKQLLSAAGYANGVDIEFIYPGNAYGQIYISALQLFQAQLKQVGINLVLKSLDKPDESQRKKEKNFTLTFTQKSVGGQDLDAYLYGTFFPSSPDNYGNIDDSQLTVMLAAQRQEADQNKRQQLSRQTARYIYDNSLALALFFPVNNELWQPYVKNYATNFGSIDPSSMNSWLEK